jgi:hypothetical protein
MIFLDNGKVTKNWVKIECSAKQTMSGEVSFDISAAAVGNRYPSLFPGSDVYKDIPVSKFN